MTGTERKILMPSTSRKPMNFVSGSGHTAGSAGVMCHQIAGLYDLEETLGKGHFAIVKAAKHVFTGERVAVKVIDKTKLDKMSQKALIQEVICMKLVQHANIIRLYEVIDTSTKMYLVLELGHGDLYDLILKQQGGLGEDVSRRYFSQIVSAVSYCHKLHVVHRDLKPENIVYFPNSNGGQVKLTDFGFSNRFYPGIKLETSCGSLAYSAPEILLGDSYDAPAVDVWSLGIILYMLVCGRVPFQEANDSETLTMIMDVKYSIPAHVSVPCHHLISSMLIRYPEKRATLDEIQNNIWLNQDDYLEKQIQTPLIIDYHLTKDEKNEIVQQMVNGQIGTREEILEAVDKNAYNHVTSTFYLLAEKHIKEHGLDLGTERQQSGINSTLTSSLESLHDRRKNSSGHSGPSDTDEFGSGCEEDTLGPLDLEMKNASISTAQAVKKTYRLHTTHSSSALSDMDKTLPILEEDVTAHSEEEDNAGPLLSKRLILHRQPMYNHRRVMIPQRSTSCSSSEDEDSEKKKKKTNGRGGGGGGSGSGLTTKHKHLTKSSNTNNPSNNRQNDYNFQEIKKKFFDDESSDEHGGASAGTNISNFSRVNINKQSGQGETREQRVGGTTDHQQQTKKDGNNSQNSNTNTNTSSTSMMTTKTTTTQLCQVKIIPIDDDDDDGSCCSPRSESPSKRYLSLSKSNDYLSEQRHSSNYYNDGHDLLGFTNTTPTTPTSTSTKTTSTTINSMSLVQDTISNSCTGSSIEPHSSLTTSSFNLAKKGKKLFLNWFFFKRGNSSSTTTTSTMNSKKKNDSLSPNNGIPGSSRIYKTKSCSELKIKNINVKQVPSERDVNQNL